MFSVPTEVDLFFIYIYFLKYLPLSFSVELTTQLSLKDNSNFPSRKTKKS